MVKLLSERYKGRRLIMYPDASGNSNKTSSSTTDHIMLKKIGAVKSPSKNGRVKDRVNTMNGMFCNSEGLRRYTVNTNKCPEYTDCLEQQAYNAHGEPDKSKDNDHANDGSGYFIVRVFPLKRRFRELTIGS